MDFQSQNYIELLQEFEKSQEYEIETDLRFTKKKKTYHNNIQNDDGKPITLNYDFINTSDTIEYIIKHTEQHLATLI